MAFDNLSLLEAADAELERIVAAVSPASWNNPTPCAITVRELVEHVVGGNHFATRLLAGASAADAVAGLDADQLGDAPLTAVTTSCKDQREAFATADQSRALHHPSGDITFDTFLRFRLGDLVIHTWDIAIGAGLDPTLDPAVVDGLWAMVEPHLDDMRAMGGFGAGASSTLPTGASLQYQLLDAFGRRP
jgi:uncharacterized protein (TIGR03086 family)